MITIYPKFKVEATIEVIQSGKGPMQITNTEMK